VILTKAQQKRLKDTARSIGVDLAGLGSSKIGALPEKHPLCALEYLIHEVAHAVTLGEVLDELEDLETSTFRRFGVIERATGDALEIDATVVAFLAGKNLGLWGSRDLRHFVRSCSNNTNSLSHGQVKRRVNAAVGIHISTRHSLQASHLMSWLKDNVL
jgi:hypothetical protein